MRRWLDQRGAGETFAAGPTASTRRSCDERAHHRHPHRHRARRRGAPARAAARRSPRPGARELGPDATRRRGRRLGGAHLPPHSRRRLPMADAVLPQLVAARSRASTCCSSTPATTSPRPRHPRRGGARAGRARRRRAARSAPSPSRTPSTGAKLYYRDPAACCRLRKVEPLKEALAGYEAWVTGIRRDEAPTRADTPLVTFDERRAGQGQSRRDLDLRDLLGYASATRVPLNLLLPDGYPSIGCAPCTRPVAPGEDPRAGRWAGLAKTECGIHTPAERSQR